MTTAEATRPTAKIYIFPVRERTQGLDRFAAMEAAVRRAPNIAAESSWYHEDALREQDAKQAR